MRQVVLSRCCHCASSASTSLIRLGPAPRFKHHLAAASLAPESPLAFEVDGSSSNRRSSSRAPELESATKKHRAKTSNTKASQRLSTNLYSDTADTNGVALDDAIHSPEVLRAALLQVRSEDNATLIHLALRVQVSASHMPIAHAAKIYGLLIKRLGAHYLLAALSPSVGAFLVRMEEAILAGDVYTPRIQGLYRPVLSAMQYFAAAEDRSAKRMEPLPDIVRHEIHRIVLHMVEAMERAPSSSTEKPTPLDPATLQILVNGRTMSTRLADVLFGYAKRSGNMLSPEVLHQFFVTTAREGNARSASTYLRLIAKSTSHAESGPDAYEGAVSRSKAPDSRKGKQKEAREVQEKLFRAIYDPELDSMLSRLMPYLYAGDDPDGDHDLTRGASFPGREQWLQKLRHAWSMLIVRAGKQPSVTTAQILDLHAAMPEDAVCAHTLTPIMNALLALDDPDAAWNIWRDAVNQEDTLEEPGRYVDRVTLAVASEICGRREGLDAAIMLVDRHALRATKTNHGPRQRSSESRILLDTQNVNILIREAAVARSPSTAFRLWTASRPRYGPRMNGFSLGLLMNAARLCEYTPADDPDGFVDDVNTRWRLLLSELDPRRHFRADVAPKADEKNRQYEEEMFSKSDVRILLDPPGYKWYAAYGTYRPWQRARHIFREVVLHNWPFLSAVRSPLTVQSGLLGLASWGGSLTASPPIEHATTLPLPNAQYMHIVPPPGTWEAYINLLGTFSRVQEIPLALAWMKELGVKPDRRTMLMALTFVKEVEGPRRLIKKWTAEGASALVRDEEILRKWLEEWLGSGTKSIKGSEQSIVPTESEVWEHRAWISWKRRRLVL